MDDFLYIENGELVITEMLMDIPSFKEFKRYDTSTNKNFFYRAMSYIYYVYKIYGDNKSYLYNLPLLQRKKEAVRHHTGTYKKVSDFDDNKWVKKCVEDYLKYSRTQNEKLYDALKDDIERFINYVETIPHSYKKRVTGTYKNKITGEEEEYAVDIEVPNITGRIEALKQASDLQELFLKKMVDVSKEAKIVKQRALFEDKESTENIPLNSFPKSTE